MGWPFGRTLGFTILGAIAAAEKLHYVGAIGACLTPPPFAR
jgi:hypothetical protein